MIPDSIGVKHSCWNSFFLVLNNFIRFILSTLCIYSISSKSEYSWCLHYVRKYMWSLTQIMQLNTSNWFMWAKIGSVYLLFLRKIRLSRWLANLFFIIINVKSGKKKTAKICNFYLNHKKLGQNIYVLGYHFEQVSWWHIGT